VWHPALAAEALVGVGAIPCENGGLADGRRRQGVGAIKDGQ
jgi:hypothetical protein